MTHAITLGKFWPFHLGHDLMIRAAVEYHDHATIVIANDSHEKNSIVEQQMIKRFAKDLDRISFCTYVDTEEYDVDENGVATDPQYLQRWAIRLSDIAPAATHFVSSDLYGKPISELMGIKWLPIDPNRECVPISGTKIRNDIDKNWKFIVPEARYDWALKVAIVGAESTGKSTLVKCMADRGMGTCPEYGRTLSEIRQNNLDARDFSNIFVIQREMIKQATQLSSIVVTDTEAIITSLYVDKYIPEHNSDFKSIGETIAKMQKIDLYIVLAPTVPWVDDGTRVMPDQVEREKFHDCICEKLESIGANYIVIDFDNWYDRYHEALAYIQSCNRALNNQK